MPFGSINFLLKTETLHPIGIANKSVSLEESYAIQPFSLLPNIVEVFLFKHSVFSSDCLPLATAT
jgi:hypothetical protein